MILAGKTITLRPYQLADAESIAAWNSDIETTAYLGRRFRRSRTLAEIQEGLKGIIQDEQGANIFFVISDASSGEYLGGIDITSVDATDGNGVLSVVIAKKERRSSGLGTQAVGLILGYAFEQRGLHKVELRVLDANTGALRCYEKAGFRVEGRLRDHTVIDGKYCDMILMGILEEEFTR